MRVWAPHHRHEERWKMSAEVINTTLTHKPCVWHIIMNARSDACMTTHTSRGLITSCLVKLGCSIFLSSGLCNISDADSTWRCSQKCSDFIEFLFLYLASLWNVDATTHIPGYVSSEEWEWCDLACSIEWLYWKSRRHQCSLSLKEITKSQKNNTCKRPIMQQKGNAHHIVK